MGMKWDKKEFLMTVWHLLGEDLCKKVVFFSSMPLELQLWLRWFWNHLITVVNCN